MKIYYVICAAGQAPPSNKAWLQLLERASTFNAQPIVGAPGEVLVTTYPSVVVVADVPNGAGVTVMADDQSQVTQADVDAAVQTATTTEQTLEQNLQTASQRIQALLSQMPAYRSQIKADVTMFQGTAVGSTIQQEHIDAFVRMVEGFATFIELIHAHLNLTGVLVPT